MIGNGFFSPEEPERYKPLVESLLDRDHFMVMADFQAYLECSDRADAIYRQPEIWNQMAILNTAQMGYFSSDRTIQEYAQQIWQIAPIQR
jgi:starch phosphorylase